MAWRERLVWLIGLITLAAAAVVSVVVLRAPPAIAATVSGLAAIWVSAALVFLTAVLALETRRTWLQHRHPHVVVTLEPNRFMGFLDLVVENVGSGTAFGLSVTLEPDIVVLDQGERVSLAASSFLSAPVIKPKQRFHQFVGRHDEFENGQSTVTCRCVDSDGREHTSTNIIDIRTFASRSELGSDPAQTIASNIKKIREQLDRIVRSNRISVDTYDADDREAERRHWDERRAEARARAEARQRELDATPRPSTDDPQ